MPFGSVILFLGIHPKDIIQKYVNALYTKIFIIGAFITAKKKKAVTSCWQKRNDSSNHDMLTRKKIGIFKFNAHPWFTTMQRHSYATV